METATFYSYKGGVGRSLLLTNIAHFLTHSNQRVIALDLNFEAPVLHYKFNIKQQVKTGVVELLLQGLKGNALNKIRNTFIEVPGRGTLLVLPAGPAPNMEYWESLSKLQKLLVLRQGEGLLEAVLDLQMRIEEELAPDVILIDVHTGVTELNGYVTTVLSDHIILITTMNAEFLEGTYAIEKALHCVPIFENKPNRKIYTIKYGTNLIDKNQWNELFEKNFELPVKNKQDSLLTATLKYISNIDYKEKS